MTVPDMDVPLADSSSFSMEFTRLWQITGDDKYIEKVFSISEIYQEAQNSSSIPGLWPERLNAAIVNGTSSDFVGANTRYSLGALSDSAYEYLVKTHLLLGSISTRFAHMWHEAAIPIKEQLLFRAYIPEGNQTDIMFTGIATTVEENNRTDIVLESRTEHLACFAGGMFALSSQLFGNLEDLTIGKALTEGCAWAYQHAPIGIMPETFTLLACPNTNGSLPQCEWNQTFWDEYPQKISTYPPGFVSSIDTHYGLRPEAIESVFVLYRITGDNKWREVGWQMFKSIIKHTRAPYGHAALYNVMIDPTPILSSPNDPSVPQQEVTAPQKDEMESFWLAETLKYFYLLFSDPNLISLDDFVLNTEAHPLRLTERSRASV